MTEQESITNIYKWVDEETRHIDLVASWENLCDTYDALKFTDRLSDADRLEEYKWIVQQMNSFMTKIRTKLLTCKDIDAMIILLGKSYTPAGKVDLSTRKALVYQKLRQRWIAMAIIHLKTKEMEVQDG